MPEQETQEMPPGRDEENDWESAEEEPGGGLSADDLAQPTTTEDPTGDRATGLTNLRG